MEPPGHENFHDVVATDIADVEGEPGVYRVGVLFDGQRETFHVELEGHKSSFQVRESNFYLYQMRAPGLKGFVAFMRRWHRGERFRLPVDLSTVKFT